MFSPNQYQLVDFGRGRKLERFGAQLLDRPSPAADGRAISDPEAWGSATARFDLAKGGKGHWNTDESWSVRHGDCELLMQLNASGNVGLFPEQATNWDWIADRVRQSQASGDARPPRVLNLFAYTGGASLAAAASGAEVTHVDSSGPTVAWARRNAEASRMDELPIRWIVEDALKFVARECRRGNTYDGVIADPPTYGHGPKGRPFKFAQHVGELLDLSGELLRSGTTGSRFLLFSCHAPGFGVEDAVSAVSAVVPTTNGPRPVGLPLVLESGDGRALEAGVCARWSDG